MAFNLDTIKEHPYITGSVVIVGGIVFFVLMSARQSSGNSSGAASSGVLGYDAQLAQLNAGVAAQSSQQQAQVTAAQIAAQTANNQTQAQLQSSNLSTIAGLFTALYGTQAQVSENATNVAGQVTQSSNQLLYAQNMQQMQDAVLEDQINAGVKENEDNNNTELGAYNIQANYGTSLAELQEKLASEGLTDEYNLQTSEDATYAGQVSYVLAHAGDQKNSALDANNQTSLFQTILSHGNPSVAIAGDSSTSTAVVSGNGFANNLLSTIKSLGSTAIAGAFA